MKPRRPALWIAALLLALGRGAPFAPADHAEGARRALQRAKELLDGCLSADEAQRAAGRSPLEAESDARPVFRHYLLALRHLMVLVGENQTQGQSQVGRFLSALSSMLVSNTDVDAFLARAGELDIELGELVALGNQGHYYFWHGPKRHVPKKMEQLLSSRIDGEEVRSLLSSPPAAPAAAAAASRVGGLGLAYPAEARQAEILPGAAIHVAHGDVCAASDAAGKDGLRTVVVGGKAQLQPCLQSDSVIWDISGLWSSYFAGQSQQPLHDIAKLGLASTGRTSLDALALPARAWLDARLKDYCLGTAAAMRRQGQLGQLALAGPVAAEVLKTVLDSQAPPAIWLLPHDDCAPVEPRALEMAHKAGVRVVAVAAPCGTAAFERVAERESLSALALLSRWTAELGMDVAYAYPAVEDIGAAARAAKAAPPLSAESWQLLSASYALMRPMPGAAAGDFEDAFGLRGTLARAAGLASRELLSGDRPPAPARDLSEQAWKELEEDKRRFDENNFFIYRKNLLSPEAYESVKQEAARLWRSDELEPNCNLDGKDRSGGYVIDASPSRSSSLYQLFYGSEDFRQWVSRINGHMMFPSDFPMELREYPSGSQGMACHRDLLMYTNATLDLEFVYTIDNFGTCVSTYDDRKGDRHEVHSEPNSLFMLRPNAAMHCVRPSEGGHRTILKFIYVGDYRKGPDFDFYAENKCGEDNPNVRAVLARRDGAGGGPHSLEL